MKPVYWRYHVARSLSCGRNLSLWTGTPQRGLPDLSQGFSRVR